MWYVLRCPAGTEAEVIRSCREHVSVEINAFVFTYERMKRYCGKWHVETANMFPGCIFLEAGYKGMPLDKIVEVCQEEEMFLKKLCGARHHLGMSKGVIRNGMMKVTEGPLIGFENRVSNIDRHKRLARLRIPASHMEGQFPAGLEIVEKS